LPSDHFSQTGRYASSCVSLCRVSFPAMKLNFALASLSLSLSHARARARFSQLKESRDDAVSPGAAVTSAGCPGFALFLHPCAAAPPPPTCNAINQPDKFNYPAVCDKAGRASFLLSNFTYLASPLSLSLLPSAGTGVATRPARAKYAKNNLSRFTFPECVIYAADRSVRPPHPNGTENIVSISMTRD
jgi:hypothetical protein